MDIPQLLADREKTHGKYCDHALITQLLKEVMRNTPCSNYSRLESTAQETLDMTVHKIGRILAGNPNEPDHWNDIAGYNTLEAREIDRRFKLLNPSFTTAKGN